MTRRFGGEPRLFDGIAEMLVRRLDRDGQLEVRREQVRRWHAAAAAAVDEPMLRVHRLEQALGVARTHGLNDEANVILVELQAIRPEDVAKESIAVEAELPAGTIESLIDSIVEQPDWADVLARDTTPRRSGRDTSGDRAGASRPSRRVCLPSALHSGLDGRAS